MKQLYIQQYHSPLLLLFFAGWGMDEKPFINYHPQDKDFLICYDYRTMDFDDTVLQPYKEIHLVGWSMGVWAASQVLQNKSLPITGSIAINGTPFPVDEERGIAPAVFEGTLNRLNEKTLQKFRLRMCGSASAYKFFEQIAPQRSLDELKAELAAIGQQCKDLPTPSFTWQKAIIGKADRIFLPANQMCAWQDKATVIKHVAEAHYMNNLLDQANCV